MNEGVVAAVNPVGMTAYERCLEPLLKALRWHGIDRHLVEALPHYNVIDTAYMFCDVMENLNYEHHYVDVKLDDVDKRLFPALFVSDNGKVLALISKRKSEITVYDGENDKRLVFKETAVPEEFLSGRLYVFRFLTSAEVEEKPKTSWVLTAFKNNKSIILSSLLFSFFLNILALATPLFIMSVYDKVIGASSYNMLWEFTMGMVLAAIGIGLIHRTRAKLLAILAGRFDRFIGDTIFSRLLYLAPTYTESASVGAQVARIKDFDRLREFLSGPMLTVLFDLPFIVISIAIIAILGGNLVFVPLTMLTLYALMSVIVSIKVKRKTNISSLAGSRQQEFLIETIKHMRVVKYTGAQFTWQKRYRLLSAKATMSSMRLTVMTAINNSISDVIMIGSGMAVLSAGAIKVINETITIGGLIAVMILIWRVLAPVKALFNTLPRLQQVVSSFRQINRLMSIPPESQPSEVIGARSRHLHGDINFNRVSFRYNTSYNPALVGVNFKIKAGEIVALIGRNGSGKSTALKLMLGLYQPQAGSVLIDNQDIRQFNPIELRNLIGYLPQNPELFYGSIAANLRLANPTASDKALQHAAQQAGVLEDIMSLPQGFDTQIRDNSAASLSGSFQQSLCLARAYLRKGSILLLDEPGNMLDNEADAKLMQSLEQQRGHTTVVMVTHRPSHLKKADRIVLLEQGQMLIEGPPNVVLPKIPKDYL